MNILSPSTIEETIVSLLRNGSLANKTLLEGVRKTRGTLTKQGFYAALRKLKQAEVVISYKKESSLNSGWILRMQDLLASMQTAYIGGGGYSGIFNLAEGESVSYVFLNTRHLDVFWGHTQNILINNSPPGEAVFAYDPHYWFYVARKKTEKDLIKEINATGRQFLMVVGGDTSLDRSLRKDFSTDERQYRTARLFKRHNYYVTVVGDYLTEVHIDPTVAREIDEIYQGDETSAVTRLQSLLAKRSRNRIRISRNRTKARKIKARLSKDFFVKR